LTKIPAWSYSSIKLYDQCPKKFYHLRVAKDVTEPPTDAILYGKEFHSAAEHYVRDDVPIPSQFSFVKSTLDSLKQLEGIKHCEFEMGLTENLEPCGFKDPKVWWRGIADLLIINGNEARCVDYKTGKSAKYADTDQLELMALAIFKFFPEVKKVKGGLLFVISKNFIKDSYDAEKQDKMWVKWIAEHNRMKFSYANNVWNPRPSGLCKKYCPVLECAHNGRN
jgi:CRISPR/Cas system-associated exonuclease Cas4 (RecB family)